MAQDHYAALFTKLSEEGFDSREFVRRLVERGLQDLIDAGVAAHIGADPHERTARRTNRRNGKRRSSPVADPRHQGDEKERRNARGRNRCTRRAVEMRQHLFFRQSGEVG